MLIRNFCVCLILMLFVVDNAQAQNDLHIVDKVFQPSNGGVQIPGTILFLDKPLGYKISQELGKVKLWMNDSNYILVVQVQPFYVHEEAQGLTNDLKNTSGYYLKEFSFGSDSAFIYFSSRTPYGLSELTLNFSDDSTGIYITSYIPENDDKARDDMLRLLLTAHFDRKNAKDPHDLARFTVNTFGTGFSFSGCYAEHYYYRNWDRGDSPDVIMIGASTDSVTKIQLDQSFTILLTGLDAFAKDRAGYSKHDTAFNGFTAKEILYTTMAEGEAINIYYLYAHDAYRSVLLTGYSGANEPTVLAEIKKVAYTLRPK